MFRSMYSGVSGLKSHQIRMDVIGNNIANVNTVGFKSSRVTFQDILSQTLKYATGPTVTGLAGTNPMQVGIGVMVGSIDNLMTQGSLEYTGRLTDLAIEGQGFFVVTPNNGGIRFYTRDGNFGISSNKELVDSGNGYKVLGWKVGNNPTVSDTEFVDTTLPPTPIILPIGIKKMALATTGVELASNLNAASQVRQPDFSYMEVTPTGGTTQKVNIQWAEIIDSDAANGNSGEHRYEWLAQVETGGGSVLKGVTGYITFNNDGEVININGKDPAQVMPQDRVITVRDPAGNQVDIYIGNAVLSAFQSPAVATSYNPSSQPTAPTKLEVQLAGGIVSGGGNIQVQIQGLDASGGALNETLTFVDNGAQSTTNTYATITAVNGITVTPGAVAWTTNPYLQILTKDELAVVDTTTGSGLSLDKIFNNGDENEMSIGTRWVVQSYNSTTAEVGTSQTLRIKWIKGSFGKTTDDVIRDYSVGATSPWATTNPWDPVHINDSDYWQYEIEILDTGGTSASFVDANGTVITQPDGVTPLTKMRGTVIFGDNGDIIGGPGVSASNGDNITFKLRDPDDAGAPNNFIATLNAPRVKMAKDNLYFSTNGTTASTQNFIGLFEPGDAYRSSIQVYDSIGNPHNLTFTYTKAGMNEWDWKADLPNEDNGAASIQGRAGNLKWPTTGQKPTLDFDEQWDPQTGNVKKAQAISFQPAGADKMNVSLNYDLATQYQGESTMKAIGQNGFPMGVLRTFNIETNGLITGIYDSGLRSPEGQIALVSFSNPEGLVKNGDNTYLQTANSGIPLIGIAGTNGYGQIYAGTLEMSNVDLAQEFTNMIITQRGFQANTRIITTSDEMLTDVIGMKR